MRKLIGLSLSVALGLTALAAVPVAADTFEGCPPGDFDGDVELTGGSLCTIVGDIDGNVKSEGQSVSLVGSVDGNLEVKKGHIWIYGELNGNAKQEEWGWLVISGGSVDGNAEEFGRGGVSVSGFSVVDGNVGEYDAGPCVVSAFALIEGNLEGSC